MSYLTIPERCRSRATLSADESRPALCDAMLRERDGQWELLGTDSYICSVVQLEEIKDDQPGPVAGVVPRDALAALAFFKDWRFRAAEGDIKLLNGATFPRTEPGKYPNLDKLWPDAEPIARIGISTELLKRLADSLGSTDLELVITSPTSPVACRPLDALEAKYVGDRKGLIMPIKVCEP